MKHFWLSAVASAVFVLAARGQTPAKSALPAPFEWGSGLKVLLIAGGYAHDYGTWDNKFDTDLLKKAGITSVYYTENQDVAARELSHADVMVISCNLGFDNPPFREAVSNFVQAGNGVVLLHSGSFYSGKWAEFHTMLVGGGAHDHDGTSEFTETVVKDHPVVKGLPPTFKITDELYHIIPDKNASPMEVLVEASKPGGKKYPSVWVVHYGENRIVSIALGHDGPPRRAPEFSMLFTNAVKWAGKQ